MMATARGELPHGTLTFLFTDIEGSTRLVQELGERYPEVLAAHNRVLRDVFARHGGVEVRTEGDSFFVVFVEANDAVAAASEARDALADGPVRVRVGVHTGDAVVAEQDYVGLDVHRAARVADAGHGGQVLVSETTRRLLDTSGELRDLGEHRLKDLSGPLRLYQLGDGEFPKLRTLHQTNLPIQPTAIVGRDQELEEAGALLRDHRMLTLTGPGGSGKTRLSLQLAADAVEAFPDGVFWVPLQALVDPALVERAIASSLGAEGDLIEFIADKRLLVLLDNFEQVIGAASTISSLLAATPNAKVLVTSREPLQIRSEQRFPVEPLRNDDAAVLFIERACAVAPAFRPTPAVGEICRRLDDLPLAIELAAPRVALLDPDELLSRIDRRLPLLTSHARDVPARQRTLRATIEWSYLLLAPEEQDLLRRLAVFTGTFSLQAAETICGADLDTLELLVVKNLVRRWGSGRIGMLETIREYALERLEESPAAEDLRRRHAEFFLEVAESANLNSGKLLPGGQRLDIAIAEQDNLRGALAWTLARGSITLGLQIAVAMETFWVARDPREGMRWFAAFLEDPEAEGVAPDLRAHALRSYGSSMYIAGDIEAAEPVWERSLALFQQLDDEGGQAVLLHRLGLTAMRAGEPGRGRELVERSDEIHGRTGDRWGLAQTRGTLGALARDAGDEQRAFELMEQSAVLAREVGVRWWEGGMLAELAMLLVGAGRLDEAESYARESLSLPEEVMDRAGRVFGVGLLACIAAERGQLERAGHLWGAIEHQDAVAPLGGWRRHRQSCEARILRTADPAFEEARVEGRRLAIEGAAALAMEPVDGQPGRDRVEEAM